MRRRPNHDELDRLNQAEEDIRKLKLAQMESSAVAPGAFCQIENHADWADGTAGAYAQANYNSIFDQSGGFSLVDPVTLSLPEGLYVVEWSFKFWFPFVNPYTGGYFGQGWSLWRGGPVAIANSVRNYTSYDERMLIPVDLTDDGGGDASVRPEADKLIAWRGIVRASGTSVNLSLGIIDFYDLYPAALDWTSDFTAAGQAASNGTGSHNIWIGSIG